MTIFNKFSQNRGFQS